MPLPFAYEHLIATTPDWPQPGVLFRDISPLLRERFTETIDALAGLFTPDEIKHTDAFVGIDARGFIFASALAQKFNKGMVMVRKGGKLPPPSHQQTYTLEYGTATLELKPGTGKVIVLDDVLATGGTLTAAADLCAAAGYNVTALATLIDLKFLSGDFTWRNIQPRAVVVYS